MNKAILVYITAPRSETAFIIAEALVSDGLAAGANVGGPIHSFYKWQGALKEATEWQLFAQTTESAFPALKKRVRELHPHQVPCIIATEIAAGDSPILEWISANSGGQGNCV